MSDNSKRLLVIPQNPKKDGNTDWVIRSTRGQDRIFNTKKRAISVARNIAQSKGRQLVIFSQNGAVQKIFDYRKNRIKVPALHVRSSLDSKSLRNAIVEVQVSE